MKLLVLTGGVGGAKLSLGFAKLLPTSDVTFLVNTGDDFEHLDLPISPDIDTLVYTLAGLANPDTGWGHVDDTWNFMSALETLGAETWFRLGDRDLAIHIRRRQLLNSGHSLTAATRCIARSLGVFHDVLPMCDEPVRTVVLTRDGPLPFQHYFVRDRCEPAVTGFRFDGSERAKPNEEIDFATYDAVVIAPSNPFVSIQPILSVPGFEKQIASNQIPVVAVSPIVGNRALKGPTAKMMKELGIPSSSIEVAKYYRHLLTGFVLDQTDRDAQAAIQQLGMKCDVQQTVMVSLADRIDLARSVLSFIANHF